MHVTHTILRIFLTPRCLGLRTWLFFGIQYNLSTVKPVLSGHSKIDKTNVLKPCGTLMQVKSIAECSPWSILQYSWPAFRDNWSWKPIFDLFKSGRLRQVLLYIDGGTFNLVFSDPHTFFDWLLWNFACKYIKVWGYASRYSQIKCCYFSCHFLLSSFKTHSMIAHI